MAAWKMSINACEEMPSRVSVFSSNSLARRVRSAKSAADDWPSSVRSGLTAIC